MQWLSESEITSIKIRIFYWKRIRYRMDRDDDDDEKDSCNQIKFTLNLWLSKSTQFTVSPIDQHLSWLISWRKTWMFVKYAKYVWAHARTIAWMKHHFWLKHNPHKHAHHVEIIRWLKRTRHEWAIDRYTTWIIHHILLNWKLISTYQNNINLPLEKHWFFLSKIFRLLRFKDKKVAFLSERWFSSHSSMTHMSMRYT